MASKGCFGQGGRQKLLRRCLWKEKRKGIVLNRTLWKELGKVRQGSRICAEGEGIKAQGLSGVSTEPGSHGGRE